MTIPTPFTRLAPLAAGLTLLAGLLGAPSALGKAQPPRAHAANSYVTGIGDEKTEMFTNPLWQQLHTRITRYIVPYDAAVRPYSLRLATAWIRAAEAQNQQILIAFYHSEYTATRMPSVGTYQSDVKKFIALFPNVRQYQPWNETNRGNVARQFDSPSPKAAAEYYKALKAVCKGCTVLGLDILDQNNIQPTLRYISQFKREIGHLKAPMPGLWGLHNYSDTNRFSSSRTRAILRAVPGKVWLTETGGLVQFPPSFTNRHGSGITRATKALKYMFALASSSSRIQRLYIYDWSGGTSSTHFDAGLMNARYQPRPGYVVVCRQLHAPHCNVKTVNN